MSGTDGERRAQMGSGGHRGGAVGTEGERWVLSVHYGNSILNFSSKKVLASV